MRIASSVFTLALGFLLPLAVSASTWTDASGQAFSAPAHPPARVVTLAPALAEVVAAVTPLAKARLVGVSDYSDFPIWVKDVRSVGPFTRVNLETVATLKPDLILASTDGNSAEQIARLRKLGFPVLVVRSATIEEWLESFTWIGRALGEEKAGEAVASDLRARFHALESRAAGRVQTFGRKSRAFVLLGVDPWITIGKGSFLFDALERIGVDPRVGGVELKGAYPKCSREAIWAAPWDAIVVPMMGNEVALTARDQKFFADKKIPVRSISGDLLLRPSPRLIEGLTQFQEALFGESGKK